MKPPRCYFLSVSTNARKSLATLALLAPASRNSHETRRSNVSGPRCKHETGFTSNKADNALRVPSLLKLTFRERGLGFHERNRTLVKPVRVAAARRLAGETWIRLASLYLDDVKKCRFTNRFFWSSCAKLQLDKPDSSSSLH